MNILVFLTTKKLKSMANSNIYITFMSESMLYYFLFLKFIKLNEIFCKISKKLENSQTI